MEEATVGPSTLSPPSLPLRTRLATWLPAALNKLVLRPDGTVNRRILNLTNFTTPANPHPIKGVKTYDVTVDSSRNLWFRVFDPIHHGQEDLPVVVYFHGGGFVYHGPNTKCFDAFCREIAVRIPAVIVSVNYRLSPEHPHPAQYEDGFDVLKFLDGDSNNEKVLPENANVNACFVAGDSAGGNIAHHVAKTAAESEFRHVKVIGLVTIHPFFGGEERTECEKRMVKPILVTVERTDWAWKAFMPQGDRDHEAINVSGPRAADISRLTEFPATIIFIGGLDVLQDWQRRYYEWLKKSGKEAYLVEYPNMFHGFAVILDLPETVQLISEVKEFVHKQRQKFKV